MSRTDAFFLGLWLFGYGLALGFEWRIGLVILIYVATLPLAEYIVAKIAARRRRREGTPG